MTQREYEHAHLPVDRLPIGSVIIERFRVWPQIIKEAGELFEVRLYEVELHLFNEWVRYSYRTKKGSDVLYTMDDYGNIKSPSVFREPTQLSTRLPLTSC